MKPEDYRVHIHGSEVSATVARSVPLRNSETLLHRTDRQPIADRIRTHFLRLKNSSEIDTIRTELADFSIRARFSLPGEKPILLDINPQSPNSKFGSDLNIGCGLKLIVASILHDHIARGNCELHTNLSEALDIRLLQRTPGSRFLIKDLLNHRHGLMDDLVKPMDFLEDGRINESKLISALNEKKPWFEPGVHYGYSRAGYWLLGAVLQRLDGRSFADIVGSHGVQIEDTFCPAMGDGCHISSERLLEFLVQSQMRASRGEICAPVPPFASNVSPMPGWHPSEQGMQCGWKVFSDGWLGHRVILHKDIGIIGVHPESGASLLLWTHPLFAAPIRNRLFGDILPDASFRIPKRMKPQEWAQKTSARYLGSFGSETTAIRFEAASAQGMSAVLESKIHDKTYRLSYEYVPAEQDIFYAIPRGRVFSFIQFLSNTSGSIYALWNGVRVLPRVA